jgi:hypothetical protein
MMDNLQQTDHIDPGGGLDDPADGRLHPPDRKSIQVERLGCGVMSLVLVAAGLVGGVTGAIALWSQWLAVSGIAAAFVVVVGLLATGAWWWPLAAYRHRWYRLDDDGLEIRNGVIFRRVVYVPRSRVQHTDVNQGPIERLFGLAHLVIHTAGTLSASVTLAGLDQDRAIRIRNHLVRTGDDDAV